MMMVLKRREVLIGALILLIGIAGIINWNYGKKADDPNTIVASSVANEADISSEHSSEPVDVQSKNYGDAQYVNATITNSYFAEAKISRETSRSQAIETLTAIVDNQNADAESKSTAQKKIIELATATDKENTCENLIKAKGYQEAVVFINGGVVNVTVKTEGLSQTDSAKIQEIITSQTSISTKNIKIVEVK